MNVGHLMDEEIRYKLMKKIGSTPEVSQRELSAELGISLGKVNYCLKALVAAGCVTMSKLATSKKRSVSHGYFLTSLGRREKITSILRFLEYKEKQAANLQKEIEDLKKEISTNN
jgi:EPS-associated MarR family transcriptional regulator